MADGDLGRLIVTVGANITDLNKGLKEATEKVNSTVGNIEKSIGTLSKSFALAGAAITGAFGLIIKQTIDYNNQIFEVSQKTGIATETLSQLKFVADQTESSFEAVSVGLKILARNIFDAENGNSKLKDTFNALNINLRDANGNLQTTENVFFQVADAVSHTTNTTEKAAIALHIFGRSGADLIPILNLGRDGIKRLQEEADKLGLTLTSKNAKQIDEFADNMDKLKKSAGALFLEIGVNIIPALTQFVKNATEGIAKVVEWTRQNPFLTDTIIKVTASIGILFVTIGGGLAVVNSLIKLFKDTIVILSVLNPLLGALTGLRLGDLLVDMATFNSALGVTKAFIPVIGAGLAGWTLGRLISDWLQLDKLASNPDGWLAHLFNQKARDDLKETNRQLQESAQAHGVPLFNPDIGKLQRERAAAAGGGGVAEGQSPGEISAQKELDFQKQLSDEQILITQRADELKDQLRTAESQKDEEDIRNRTGLFQEDLFKRIELERDQLTQRLQQIEESGNFEVAEKQKVTDAINKLDNELARAEAERAKAKRDLDKKLTDQSLNTLEDFLKQAGEKNKAAAIAFKAIQLGRTVINTAEGISEAFPNLPLMALIAAAGAAQIATIVGQGFAQGTDSVPARLSPGEMVIPNTFAEAIRSGDLTLSGKNQPSIGGGGGGITFGNIEIHVQGSLDQEVSDNLVRRLGEEIDSRLRGAT